MKRFLKNTLLYVSLSCVVTNLYANDTEGAWGPLIDFPILPIHNVLMPDGRVMLFGSDEDGTAGNPTELEYVIWDPALGTGLDSMKIIGNTTGTDIFCAAQLVLPGSGDIFTAGGDIGLAGTAGNADTTIFDPQTETMVNDAQMSTIRWYPTLITLPNGELLIQGGSLYGGENAAPALTPEVYTPGTGWRTLLGATSDFAYGSAYRKWWYPRSWVISDGRVFGLAGPSMYYVDTLGAGSIAEAGIFPTSNNGVTSTAVMYAEDKVLQVGGGNYSSGGGGNASPFASIVDLSGPMPVVSQASQPQYARHWGNTLILADGQVMLSGGSLSSNSLAQGFYDVPELWNPQTNTWSPMAPEGEVRLYHSSTILLPDATVFSNGGGDPGPYRQMNGKIFYPPYLFDGNQLATRPSYSLEEEDFVYGEQISLTVSGSNPIARAVLVKTSAVTHSFNVEQRIIELDFSIIGNTLTTAMPTDPNKATPGHYMLFVIDSVGTPSVANILGLDYELPSSGGNLVQDSGFETLTAPLGSWLSFSDGATIGPWTVGGSGVDLHENTHRNLGNGGADGQGHIDLRGNNSGSISQTINGLVPGNTYTLNFNYALHTIAGGSASANVSIAGLSELVTATIIGSIDWTLASYTFTATSISETLTFSGLSSEGHPNTGVLIDTVSVTPLSSGSLVEGGGFEALQAPVGGWIPVTPGSSIGAWTVGGSGVDLQENTHRGLGNGGAEGQSNVDLRGTNSGSVTQTITGLVPGNTYTLTFNHAIHDLAGGSAIANVSIANFDETFTSTIVGSIDWASATYSFTANSATETLVFSGISSAGNMNTGVLIDNVIINP